jgi:hypothetical protein
MCSAYYSQLHSFFSNFYRPLSLLLSKWASRVIFSILVFTHMVLAVVVARHSAGSSKSIHKFHRRKAGFIQT